MDIGSGKNRYTTSDVEGWEAECPCGVARDRLWVRETFQPLFAEGFDHYTTDWETGKGYALPLRRHQWPRRVDR